MASRLKRHTEPKKVGRPATHGLAKENPSAYKEFFADARAKIEACPDVLQRTEILLDVLIQATLLTLEGKGNRLVNQELRAFATRINQLVPRARLYAAEQIVLGNRVPGQVRTSSGGGAMRELGDEDVPLLRSE